MCAIESRGQAQWQLAGPLQATSFRPDRGYQRHRNGIIECSKRESTAAKNKDASAESGSHHQSGRRGLISRHRKDRSKAGRQGCTDGLW